MRSGILDSQAVFVARLKGVGIPQSMIDKFLSEEVTSLAKLAFLVGTQPGSGEDTAFVTAVAEILGFDEAHPIPKGVLAALRRVWFEANTVAVNEVRQKMGRTEDSLPRKLPQPEREARRTLQQSKFPHMPLEGQLEPSHALIDLVHTIAEDDCLKYIGPEACTHREAELHGIKREPTLKIDPTGTLKQTFHDEKLLADTTTEYRLRMCLQRRSLAFDQFDLMPYNDMEKYHNYLFELITKPVPAGYKAVTVEQVLLADRQIFTKMAESLRHGLQKDALNVYPMVAALQQALSHPVITSMLQPLPRNVQSSINNLTGGKWPAKEQRRRQDRPYPEVKGKGKGKKGKRQDYRNDARKGWVPKDLAGGSARTPGGKPICFSFNLGSCQNSSKNCQKGAHVCAKCFSSDHSFSKCDKRS